MVYYIAAILITRSNKIIMVTTLPLYNPMLSLFFFLSNNVFPKRSIIYIIIIIFWIYQNEVKKFQYPKKAHLLSLPKREEEEEKLI